MAIPYIVFLGLYLLAVVILAFFALASLYHLLKFGYFSPTSIFTTFIMIAGTALIVFISYRELSAIDWSQSLDLEFVFSVINPF